LVRLKPYFLRLLKLESFWLLAFSKKIKLISLVLGFSPKKIENIILINKRLYFEYL